MAQLSLVQKIRRNNFPCFDAYSGGTVYQQAEKWLHQLLGSHAQFRPGQWEAIEALVQNRERVLVVQRTGWGKSLVYFIATRLLRSQGSGPTILISPLLSLMRNQIQAAQRLELCAETINSANSKEQNDNVEAKLLAGKVDLLLISPERLANEHFQQHVWNILCHTVGLLVVDEAHCISDWGHDFRPNYRRIMSILNDLPAHTPVLGTTATANNRVVSDVSEILGRGLRVLRGPLTRDSLALYVFPQPQSAAFRLVLLSHLLANIPGSGIIYCTTTNDCRRVSQWLQNQGHNVRPYYAEVEQDTGENRVDLEEQLLNNQVKALAASVALGMGFDKPDLHFVIHYQYPGSIIGYYQQIGRAGRGINQAPIILMHGPEDEEIQNYFIETAFPKPQHVEETIRAIQLAGDLSRNDLQKQVNVNPTTLEKILLHLEIERVIEKRDSRYCLTGLSSAPDYARWDRVTQQRRIELEQMKTYLQYEGCLMRFIATALDDPTQVRPCGQCKNCRQQEIKFDPDPQALEAASRFLREGQIILIEPRKQWPSGFSDELKGRLKTTNALGIALCYYHDPGWGDYVRRGKYQDNRFSDELVQASVILLQEHWKSLDAPPTWVTAIPSLRRPNLVSDFAARLAKVLGLPYLGVVHQVRDRPEQKTMQNSYQQLGNLWGTFTLDHPRPEPVLLVDDMCDSGWTFTIVGELLRQHGSGEVHPFALAKVSL